MKIKTISVFAANLNLTGEHSSAHTRTKVIEDVYVRVATDEGLCGYGATAPKYYITGETQDTVIAVLKKRIIPELINENPFSLERIHEKMNHAIKGNTSAKAAIDIALYDLIGKTLKVPVYQLLGGLYRDKMPAFDLIGLVSPEEAVEKFTRQLAAGYKEFKVKVGPDPEADLKRVAAINKAAQGIPLKVDANQAWSSKQAVNMTQRFSEMGVSIVEQPVHMDNLSGLAMVKNSCPNVEVMADESIKGLPETLRLIKEGVVDLLNVKLIKSGGLYNAKKIAAVAEAASINIMAGCTLQNSLIDAATAHFLASTANVVYNEIKSPQWIENDFAHGLKIKDGSVLVPDGIGLGMAIDEERLEKYRV